MTEETATPPSAEYDHRQLALVFDACFVIFAHPHERRGPRIQLGELDAVLAIFGAKKISEVSPEDEPAFRRYLDARTKSFQVAK